MKYAKNIIVVLTVFCTQFLFADVPAWDTDNDCVLDTYNFYENNGSITAKIFPNGEEGGAMGDMIAAFVDGEHSNIMMHQKMLYIIQMKQLSLHQIWLRVM